jgi:hypothetical protein
MSQGGWLRNAKPARVRSDPSDQGRVGLDYHVEIQRHYYSVPFHLLRQEAEARIITQTIEIFHHGKRVASHPKDVAREEPVALDEEKAPAPSRL